MIHCTTRPPGPPYNPSAVIPPATIAMSNMLQVDTGTHNIAQIHATIPHCGTIVMECYAHQVLITLSAGAMDINNP